MKITLVPSLLKVAECQYAKPTSDTTSNLFGLYGSVISNKIPLPEPVEAYAAGVMKAFDLVICKIDNDNGQQGVGYITVHENQGLAIASIIKNSFVPLLLDKDPRLIELHWKNMWKDTHYAGRGAPVSFAIAAVDVALWDLKGICLNEPIWRLLGGHDKNVLAYAGNIDLNFSTKKLLLGATKSLNQGFQSIKMRLGRETLSEDLKRLEAMRNHLPDNICLLYTSPSPRDRG